MTWANTAIDLILCAGFGLFVAGMFRLFCMAVSILSPSKRVADSRARFDIPQAEEFDLDLRFHGDDPSLGDGAADVYKHESERARFATGPALETCVGLMRSGDVAETDSTHVAGDLFRHDQTLAAQNPEGHGQ